MIEPVTGTLLTPDIERLDRALLDIENEVFVHEQCVWIMFDPNITRWTPRGMDVDAPPCGTGMCLFGWLAWSAGYRPLLAGRGRGEMWAPREIVKDLDPANTWDHVPGARPIFVLGAELLRVDLPSAGVLSDEHNTLEDLKLLRDRLAAGQQLAPPDREYEYDDGGYYGDDEDYYGDDHY